MPGSCPRAWEWGLPQSWVSVAAKVRAAGEYAGVKFVVGDGSKATFIVGETLAHMPLPNDAVITDSSVSGQVHLDGSPSVIKLDMRRLRSDQPTRDRYIQD